MRGFLMGLGLGLGLMYLGDPDHGEARRLQARRRLDDLMGKLKQGASETDRLNAGLMQPSRLRTETLDDVTIVERVRSELGRLVTRPGAILVTADGGVVTLRGPILAHEVPRLLDAVRMLPGVIRVGNQLRVYQQAADMPPT